MNLEELELEMKIKPLKNNEDLEICKACKSCCCKMNPCELIPSDVTDKYGYTLDVGGISAMLFSGVFTLDYYFVDLTDKDNRKAFGNKYLDDIYSKRCWFIRIKSVLDTSSVAASDYYGGACILHTPKGCLLDFDKRPFNAQALDPKACILPVEDRIKYDGFNGFGKRELAILWLKYEDILQEVLSKIESGKEN